MQMFPDPYKYFIRGEVEGPNSITANKTEPAIWKIEIYSYPDELEWKWWAVTLSVISSAHLTLTQDDSGHFVRGTFWKLDINTLRM